MNPGIPVRAASDRAEKTLLQNLGALDRFDPELAERLRLPVDEAGTRVDTQGHLELRVHRSWVSLTVDDRELERRSADTSTAARLLVLGIGAGELLERLCAGPRTVIAWERDPGLLRAFLMRTDIADSLASGRIRLSLGTDLLSLADEFAPDADASVGVIEHPLLGQLYSSEIRTFRRRARGSRVVMCAGGLFVEEVRHALEERGACTWTLDIQGLAVEELTRAIRSFRPELIFAINYTDGLAEFCARHGVRLIVWEIDASTTPPLRLDTSAELAHIFTFRRANVDGFRRAGFAHVEYLPLAADIALRHPLESGIRDIESGALVAHVGSSLVENARACRQRLLVAWSAWSKARARESDDSAAKLSEILTAQRAQPTRFLIPELLESVAPGFRAETLARPDTEDPVVLAGEIAASERRLSWAANLGRLNLAVWGDDGWRVTERYGVQFKGPAAHRVELTEIYNSVRLHWDVGRIYQLDIVTMRVFDVLACGRLVFAEHSTALTELFEVGVEVESYRNLGELQAKLAHYAENPGDADRIAQRGREAIVERHTIEARVAHMLLGAE